MKKLISFIQLVLLYAILIVMAISYHPAIMRASRADGMESGTILSRYISYLFIALFGISLFRIPRLRSSFLRNYSVCVVLITVVGIAIAAIFSNYEMLQSLRSFLIVMGAILIGWTLTPTEKQLSSLLLVFGITVVFSGLMQVYTNIGGFIIADQYLTDSKNSLGALLASAVIAFLYMWKSQGNKRLHLVSVLLAFVGLLLIVTIRARAALLAVIIMAVVYFSMYTKSKNGVVSFFIFAPLALVLFYFLPSTLGDYLNASIFAGTQAEDVTSGRMGTYRAAIEYLMGHPFIGDITNITTIPWIHNYLLLTLFQYGLLFAWPIFGLYFYILIHSCKYALKYKVAYFYMGYVIIIIPFIISLLEPTFPFGPGTVTVFNFILLGIAERSRKDILILNASSR